ncbi:polar amino acid transport system substrate-binding protein [Aequitasia blattaphilus]|uniref:Amino acid ABC transporter substrate-binding protein n=1 Tax=Aequitasia blattaphilus TaxID=2949332 RepID=A0ABT1EC48_9FIRM|nr:amino acid ABC transporter substrate-binding protein [Aequitasia blattaphilus]MCP1103405.1 amino acid ABC transporter substrate-binding protein [Aequitasia blattaphilus]MCR8616045.1 amino acid ABC transporter substrate-binding protein [Aequitasia blattaphilus]
MKKIGSLLLILVMACALVLTGCKKEETKTKDENSFIVGFDASFPPYGYKDDNGEYVGFDLDLAEEVCKRNEWTLVKQPIDWDSKDAEINAGTISCIWNGFTINGREDQYTWSEPYVDNKQVIVVAADSGIESFADLAGKLVETQADSSALHALQEDKKDLADTFSGLTEVPEYNTAFMDLESGACDGVALDIGVAMYQINSRDNSDDFKILEEEISSEQYGIGFKKGNEELRDQVQKTLDEMAEDGTIEKIAEKYADSGVPGALAIHK